MAVGESPAFRSSQMVKSLDGSPHRSRRKSTCSRSRSQLRWRRAIPAAKAPLEMRQIVEPGREGDCGHCPIRESWITQQAIRTFQALFHNILGERRAALVEQPLNVTRRYLVARRDRVDREARLGKVPRDIVLDHLHPRHPNPAAVGD